MGDKSVLLMPGEVTGAQAQMIANALGGRRNGRGKGSSRRAKRRTRKTSARSSGTRRKSRTRRRSSGSPKLVKGSAAAKRHMARLRRMRRK